ncbi:MAG TPA: lytic transglycosylase domain-containing protein [Solirubrobacteraceae bacterium]|nr:lytic transglycosylase domain-containing protein [Solirubrobacteraceae bacterium]
MRAVVVGAIAIAALLAGLIEASRPSVRSNPKSHPATQITAAAAGTSLAEPPAELANSLNQAQAVIDDPTSSPAELSDAGWFEQLSTLALERERVQTRRATLAALDGAAAATMQADLSAAGALAQLVSPRNSLPRWKIVQPPPPGTLLGYFKAAQARFGIPWQDLAAIEFIETKFGRVAGLSTAGAEGPMQFLPSTWASYGSGNVHDQRAAILGAARYLRANGAPGDIPGALHHYNPSIDYVRAVTDYASRMRGDPRAYFGYYVWQVTYALKSGLVELPAGYPAVRPVPVSPSSLSVASSGTPP